jgi:hypothetical protein
MSKLGEFDKAPFIWKDFHKCGYVTAHAEDQGYVGTFNLDKVGFEDQPTTFNFRPFERSLLPFFEIEKSKEADNMCVGHQHLSDYIYRYMVDFAKQFINDSFFGLFWTGSFSHGYWVDPTTRDLHTKKYLMELESSGILNSSVVIFLSDHGDRYGRSSLRATSVSSFFLKKN